MTLNSGHTAQLTATVTNTANRAVTWSISPVGVGSISTSDLYTAPATITTAQTVTVTATSLADTTASSSTTITLEPSVAVTVSPATIALNSGQTAQLTVAGTNVVDNGTNQLIATVTNALNPSVTWSALLGTITPEGLYTAPSNTGTSTLTDTITATSIQDPTKSATAAVIVSLGLVGWWPLNEGTGTVAHDMSGQGNNGTWRGTLSSLTGTHYTTGKIGSAAGYFNGNDNSLTIGTQPVYDFTGPFTISMWINPASLNWPAGILARENSNNGGNNGYLLVLYPYNLSPNNPKLCIEANDGTENACVAGVGVVGVGVWSLLTTVYDGTNMSLYVNGTLSAQTASALNPPANNGSLVFGTPEQGGFGSFNGSLEDIRLYSRALSASQISSLYDTYVGVPNAPTNLQAYPGNSQMGLSWDAPTTGAIVTDYTVNYRLSGASTWTAFPHSPSVVNEQVVTGLAGGTSYDFEVIPVSAVGNGTASNIVTATPAITVSVAPKATSTLPGTNITFTATVTNALNPSVTWSALLGTITPEGLYTAPSNMGSSTLTDTITATSIQDPTKSATAAVTVSSSLVGWWPLNEGMGTVAYDHSGQGNNGKWIGTPSSPIGISYYTTGKIGSAAGYFNGNDNSLTIGTQPVYDFTGPFTISMWINPASLNWPAGILAREINGNQGYLLVLYPYNLSPNNPKLCIEANDGTENACVAGVGVVGVGVWSLLTTVYDGTNMSLYVNGTLSAQTASALNPPANNGSLVFGTPEQGGFGSFNGSLEDIRLYSRALSASQISFPL